jgi:structural maintenance of chromosome 4
MIHFLLRSSFLPIFHLAKTQAEDAKEAMKAGNSRSKAVSGILKAACTGNELAHVGILGRLGDLATISDQYDVAVSTACGFLDHIVVQTTKDAQNCLDYLRKHKLGRANFIPLEKMKKGAHDRVVETPEGAPRLFELITPSNFAITPALFLGVGNTLVAPDLETATRWAYDFGMRWRVVTIDGNLIEMSGTMQGGGKTVRRGGMRFTNSNSTAASNNPLTDGFQDECDKLEANAEQALQNLKQCRSHRRGLAGEIRDLKKRVKMLSVQIPKLSMEISSCDTTREELTNRLPDLRAQCILSAEDSAKLTELNSKVAKCKSDMASCAMLASELEADVARLQKSILDAGGSRLKKQQKACEKVLADLNSTTTKLNSAKVLITSSQKAAEKAKAAKAVVEKEFETAKRTLQDKKEEFKKLEEEAFAVMQAYEQVQTFEREKKHALEAVLKETEGLRKSQAEIKCTEVEITAKIESCAKSINDNEKRLKHWVRELKQLRKAEKHDEDYDMTDDEDEDDDIKGDEVVESGSAEKADGDVAMEDVSENLAEQTKSCQKESSLPTYNESALGQYDVTEVKDDITTLEKERDCMSKNANMTAIAEYRKKEADYLTRYVVHTIIVMLCGIHYYYHIV